MYNRHHDVPAWVDRELTPEMVLAEFAERGTVLFLVVEEAGEVLGTLGMFRACGMRVVPENEVIGSMFYLAPGSVAACWPGSCSRWPSAPYGTRASRRSD
ncbi:hypothetical protein ACFQ0T_22240 [Kitasatospora gansuensis]